MDRQARFGIRTESELEQSGELSRRTSGIGETAECMEF